MPDEARPLSSLRPPLHPRAAELIATLGLQPHPEGGHYAELHRSAAAVDPRDGRPLRAAMTSIDFMLAEGQASAWHRVASDEAWHLLEAAPGAAASAPAALRLWLIDPGLTRLESVTVAPVDPAGHRPRHLVPAHWWQAAEPLGAFAYVGATVGPGFDFADFAFGRSDAAFCAALARLAPQLQRLL
jgi:predicted cupin superfamily sugar epimerase